MNYLPKLTCFYQAYFTFKNMSSRFAIESMVMRFSILICQSVLTFSPSCSFLPFFQCSKVAQVALFLSTYKSTLSPSFKNQPKSVSRSSPEILGRMSGHWTPTSGGVLTCQYIIPYLALYYTTRSNSFQMHSQVYSPGSY